MTSDIADIKRRFADTCAVENNKDRIVEDLFSYIEALHADVQSKGDEADNHQRVIRSLREENTRNKSDLEDIRRHLDDIRRDQAKLSYVSVLVDGDGMHFHGKLIQDGHDGGYEAARLLLQAAEEHIPQVDPEAPPNTCCRIHVYANVEGLTKVYRANDILPADGSMAAFIQGFNKMSPLCDFVDVGHGKECSDVKLRAHFEQNIVDVHCRRVIFCASTDNGYARVLGNHRGSDRITLIEGPPFAREMDELAEHFETASFESVFRPDKLPPAKRVSFGDSRAAAITPPRSPNQDYASAAKASPELSPPSPASNAPTKQRQICVNARGQRVDQPLPISQWHRVYKLKERKMCNQFHLLGSCDYGDDCLYDHESLLSAQEKIDLTYIARLSVCQNGPFCRDADCLCGHCCPRAKCAGSGCRFPDSMHGIDTTCTTLTTV